MSLPDLPQINTSHSIVNHEQLGTLIRERYDVGQDTYCELIHRGMNDVFKVRDGGEVTACRVWRTEWRSFDDVAYELGFLEHLTDAGVSVGNVIRTRQDETYFAVQAPEGPRAVGLFKWADGKKFGDAPTPELAFSIGALFAQMHMAGATYKPASVRRTNVPTDYIDNLPYLRKLVSDRPDDIRLYEAISTSLFDAVQAVKSRDLPFGPGHGDFHFNNVHIAAPDKITLLDFDNSGEDYLIQDIACYVWANHYGNLDNTYADNFVRGYSSVRALTKDEEEALPLFVLAKEFRLISGFAKNVNQIGHFPLRFRSLAWFAESLRNRATTLGII